MVTGASIGSFLSVLIKRLHSGQKGIIKGHSACPNCKKRLHAIDLIPLISFIALQGKCRYCQKRIDPFYFFLELMTAVIFALMFIKYPFLQEFPIVQIDKNQIMHFLFYLITGIFLLGIFFSDLLFQEIPDLFLFPLIIFTFTGGLILGITQFSDMIIAGAITLIVFGGQILISHGKWLGEGDLYLGFSMAFLFGWKLFLVALVITYTLGAIVSIALLILKKVGSTSKIAFAPFLVIGTFLTLFYGESLLQWYISTLIL